MRVVSYRLKTFIFIGDLLLVLHGSDRIAVHVLQDTIWFQIKQQKETTTTTAAAAAATKTT